MEGYRFDVVTDHLGLKWLNSIDNPTGRIARWALELQRHQFDARYRCWKIDIMADSLSRQPLDTVQQVRVETPECKWIKKMASLVTQQQEKFPHYRLEREQLYRRMGTVPEEEDETLWKLCVGRGYRLRVLHECNDHPTAGNSRNTTGRDYFER